MTTARERQAIPASRYLRLVRSDRTTHQQAPGVAATPAPAQSQPLEDRAAAIEKSVEKLAAFFTDFLAVGERMGRAAVDPGAPAGQHDDPDMQPTLDPATLKLWEFARLARGWDGRRADPPSPIACESARQVIALALAVGFPPSRVVPDVEGGVAVYWFSAATLEDGGPARRAGVSVDNEGMMAASTKAGREPLVAWDITLGQVRGELPGLSAFVRG